MEPEEADQVDGGEAVDLTTLQLLDGLRNEVVAVKEVIKLIILVAF